MPRAGADGRGWHAHQQPQESCDNDACANDGSPGRRRRARERAAREPFRGANADKKYTPARGAFVGQRRHADGETAVAANKLTKIADSGQHNAADCHTPSGLCGSGRTKVDTQHTRSAGLGRESAPARVSRRRISSAIRQPHGSLFHSLFWDTRRAHQPRRKVRTQIQSSCVKSVTLAAQGVPLDCRPDRFVTPLDARSPRLFAHGFHVFRPTDRDAPC
jgi:hypothetical protein